MEIITTSKLNGVASSLLSSDKSFYLNKQKPILGFNSSYKISKGFKEKDFTTGILYLQPADSVSLRTLCSNADPAGCKQDCLGKTSGRLALNDSQKAMTRRTIQYLIDPDDFKERLRKEIIKNETDKYCIRLNGTSDEDWSDLISSVPNVQFYDYTKVFHRVARNTLPNYHLTYSGSFNNSKMIIKTKKAVSMGFNVTLALNTKESAGEFKRPDELIINGIKRKLINHDVTDLRFLDPVGSIGTLIRKGSTIKKRAEDMLKPCFFGSPKTLSMLA